MIAKCTKCRVGGLILGISLVVGGPGHVGADPPRTFSGLLTSQTIPGTQVTRGTVSSSLRTLSGNLSPFGPVSGLIQQNVDLSTFQFVGYFALEAHGGTIFGYVTGQLAPNPHDPTSQSFLVSEQVYLTGGTGRWSGLSGTGTGLGIASASGTSTETDSGTFTTGGH